MLNPRYSAAEAIVIQGESLVVVLAVVEVLLGMQVLCGRGLAGWGPYLSVTMRAQISD